MLRFMGVLLCESFANFMSCYSFLGVIKALEKLAGGSRKKPNKFSITLTGLYKMLAESKE